MEWFGLAALILGTYISIGNWVYFFRGQSAIPLIGAALLAIGLQSFPITRPYLLLSLLDFGFLALVIALPRLAWDAWETSRFRLLKRFEARTADADYSLRLYKGFVFVIQADFHPQVPQVYPIMLQFGLHGRWHMHEDDIVLENYANDRRTVLHRQVSGFHAAETADPNDTRDATRLHGITFTRVD
ncbi:MAG TPA: hypothetical protein VE954_21005 [Oligoflexus sp.]|uniref:hypothetical protein n=1 Tax=Oligoflexus sp. TaxID=1971216 RepID=UPI002D4D5BD0|nr:hypothetical protein [Oligoflexus sp.]HYX35584.1 hypothetical protein [Oligoflexus sp.]